MDKKPPFFVSIDILRERVRSIRTRLNVISLIALFMLMANAKPTGFALFGITLASANSNVIHGFFIAIIFTMLVEFICYFFIDSEARKVETLETTQIATMEIDNSQHFNSTMQTDEEVRKMAMEKLNANVKAALVSIMRFMSEFL